MIELLIVVFIIALVIAAAVSSLRSTEGQSKSNRARTTAVQLGEAIQQFQRDHGGRLPGAPGTTDWAWRATNGRLMSQWTSPVDAGNGSRPYVAARVVQVIADGAVSLETAAGRAGPGASRTARVRYLPEPARSRFVLVTFVDRGEGRRGDCFVSPSTTTVAQAIMRANRITGVTRRC